MCQGYPIAHPYQPNFLLGKSNIKPSMFDVLQQGQPERKKGFSKLQLGRSWFSINVS